MWEKNRKSGSFSQGKCCEYQPWFEVTVHTGFLTKKHQPNLVEDRTVEETCGAFFFLVSI